MSLSNDTLVERVKADPNFQELVRKRSVFAWTLSLMMLAIYFGFVLTIAFDKALLAKSLAGRRDDCGNSRGSRRDRVGLRADRHLRRPCEHGV